MIDEGKRSGKFLRSLRALLIGGDMLPVSLIQKLQRENTAAIYNMYGPTETTIWSCIHKFENDVQRVRIGKPIANTQIYILNKYLHLAPVGVAGDLYIGGEGVSVGYHNRQELTAQRFIANPFKAEGKIYMTGDVARWLPDGTIELLGRTDNQVKIRGHRIELGEIEHQISRYEGIKEVVIMARERLGEKYLVAYYVSHQSIEPALLRNSLHQLLPDSICH
jgi:non-ribosomal peptide synthetase component F